VGAGKSAAAMAAAVEAAWDGPLSGVVVTRYRHGAPTRQIEVLEAAHPVPDEAGVVASRRILEAVREAGEDDLVLALISGGGSALMVAPVEGLSFADKQKVNAELLRSGANIHEINCVRKHLSAIKGGRLLQAALPARVVTLAISDVPGDDPAAIASGPTVPDHTTLAEAREILDRYNIGANGGVRAALDNPANETPSDADIGISSWDYRLIASPAQSLDRAAELARGAGVEVIAMGDTIEGEARDFGRDLARHAKEIASGPHDRPVLLLSGGELTVTIRNEAGRGGPSGECALAFLLETGGQSGLTALFADTDGIDGSEDNAGALVTPEIFAAARRQGLDGAALLAANLSHDFFAGAGGLFVTGPTRTNVNDFRAVLIA
jgi:hydroxypyruvate reductase